MVLVEDNQGTKIDEIEKDFADIEKESHFEAARIKILLPPIFKTTKIMGIQKCEKLATDDQESEKFS